MNSRTTARTAAWALIAVSIAGCGAMDLTEVRSVGLVTARPATTIGPSGGEGPAPWREFSVRLSRRHVQAALGAQSTVHLQLFDCETKAWVGVEDIYLGGGSLNEHQTVSLPPKAGPFVTGRFYIRQDDLKADRAICAHVRGGTMYGWTLVGGTVRLPR